MKTLIRRRAGEQLSGVKRCRRKFRHFFAGGFHDQTYDAWERGYKWAAHLQWEELLAQESFAQLLQAREYQRVAQHVVRVESRTNLLFSFEKMALRDAVKTPAAAELFATSLYAFLYGERTPEQRFEGWINALANLPRRQTRVVTWPVVSVFGFLAQPRKHIFLKPNVTRRAAAEYGYDFRYTSRPNWETYSSLLRFAGIVRRDLADMKPRDMIDIQSFLWVQGSDEYTE